MFVSVVFVEEAKAKLDKIEGQAKKEKRQVIIDLAKDLEGKIPIDSISVEIVTQLRGRVSESFIHQCLDDKYKQKHRVENAKKRKKKEGQEEDISEENIAPLPLLNHHEAEENKKAIIIDAEGRSTTIIEDKEKADNMTADSSTFTAKASSHPHGIKEETYGLMQSATENKRFPLLIPLSIIGLFYHII